MIHVQRSQAIGIAAILVVFFLAEFVVQYGFPPHAIDQAQVDRR